MSDFNRELNNKNMVYLYEAYHIGLSSDSKNDILVEISSYNSNFFNHAKKMLEIYSIFLQDYLEFVNKYEFSACPLNFMKHSVKHNIMINDSLKEMDFRVEDDHIYFSDGKNRENDFINFGEFYIKNYKVNCCSSYMFIEDIITEKKYIYYGD